MKGKHKLLFMIVAVITAILVFFGGILGAGFTTILGGVASSIGLFSEEQTQDEQLNLIRYGCSCGDCSGGITYLSGNIISGSSSGELLGGDYSSTHNTNSLAFTSELIPGLNAEQDANAKEIYVWLRQYGFTDAAAFGVLGNIWQESRMYPGAWLGSVPGTWNNQKSSRFGLVQASVSNISDEWIPYLDSIGKSIDTIDGQLSAIVYLLTSGSERKCFDTYLSKEYKTDFTGFMQLTDSNLACDMFCVAYERCVNGTDKSITSKKSRNKYQHLEDRKKHTQTIETYFKNNTINSNGSITTNKGGMTVPSKGQLDASRGEYGIPIWTGYSMNDTDNTVVVPIETDTRIETKIATTTPNVFEKDTKTIAERGADAIVSTEYITSGQCELMNGRLKIAIASGAVAWDKDPDHDNSMIGTLVDVVLKDGSVIPCVVSDAKGNVHTGDLHMFYTGGYGRASHGEDAWLPRDYSFIEIYRGTKNASGYAAQAWLTKFCKEAGGISHFKVYNHTNKAYALANNAIQPGQQPTVNNSVIPQPGNDSTTSEVKSSVKLTYGTENVDLDDWTPTRTLNKEYDITECKPITVHLNLLPDKNSKPFTGPIDSLVVHYWAGSGRSGNNIYSTFTGNGLSSNFSIGTDGELWQFVSLDRTGFANNMNTNRLSVEVANLSNGLYNYSKESYETLVHLAAWIAVKYNLSTDFNWQYNYKNGQQLNKYRDLGDIRRHYDNQMGEKPAYTNYFRGKTCPAYWVPKDGSSESDSLATAGGNARWIAFKEHVTEYIIRFKNDPNFEIQGVAGVDSINTYKREDSNANWLNGYAYSNGNSSSGSLVGGYIGKTCGCSIPCNKCDCHDSEWEAIKSGQPNLDGNSSSSHNSLSGSGVSDGVQLSGATAKERGLMTLEGSLYTIENGVLTWTGNDWNSTVFLSAARSLMIKMCNAGMKYKYGGYTNLEGIGRMRTDCSGYVSMLLKQIGYGNSGFEGSQTEWSHLGFEKITSESDLKPGDIVQFTNTNHTNIFCGWINQSTRTMAVYDFGGTYWNKEGPNYYEPMEYSPKASKRFVAAWRPVPIDTTIDGKTYSAYGYIEGIENKTSTGTSVEDTSTASLNTDTYLYE